VTLPPPLLALLADYCRRQALHWSQDLLTAGRRPLGENQLRKATVQLTRSTGVKPLHPHAYRHSAAYRLMRAGVVANKVAAILGHAQTSLTVNVYGHFQTGNNAVAVAAMGSIFDDSEPLGVTLGGDKPDSRTK
jgi:integrase